MFEESAAWGVSESSTGDIVQDTIKKEKLVQDLLASLGNLGALYEKVQTVREDIDKLNSGNATLQMYIDNLTMQMAKRR